MIEVHKNVDAEDNTMTVTIRGNAEMIAQEYVALTLKLHDAYPVILDRANWYLDDILELRKEINND